MGERILDHTGGLCPPFREVNGNDAEAIVDCHLTADSIYEEADSKSEQTAG
jgi:(2Fe-2S) ferredoxin